MTALNSQYRGSEEPALFFSSKLREAGKFADKWPRPGARTIQRADIDASKFEEFHYPSIAEEVTGERDPLYTPEIMREILARTKPAKAPGATIRNVRNFEGGPLSDTYAVLDPGVLSGLRRYRFGGDAPGSPSLAEPIPQYEEGGTVAETGLALVHAGEKNFPVGEAPRSDSAAAAKIAAHDAAFPERDLTLGGSIDYAQRAIVQQKPQALTDAEIAPVGSAWGPQVWDACNAQAHGSAFGCVRVESGRKDRLVFDTACPGLTVRVTARGRRIFLVQWTDRAMTARYANLSASGAP